jgi:hypothetical protein
MKSPSKTPSLALYGFLTILSSASVLYISLFITSIFSIGLFENSQFIKLITFFGLLGLSLILFDLKFLTRIRKCSTRPYLCDKATTKVTVVLTAFNDESSIGLAVDDFKCSPFVSRVIVIDNNSSDRTASVATLAGAIIHTELKPGYGQCVYRALYEASVFTDTESVILCEGDMTFRSGDIPKLLAYSKHAQIVNGTRIVEQLREPDTQLTWFMYIGNFIGGKLLQLKHLGRGTVTDLGTTYKLCDSEFLRSNLHLFDPNVNLEFNAHFLDTVLTNSFSFVEVPITFHKRIGDSKGGNVSNFRAAKVGMRMFLGIIFGWKTFGKA